MSMVRLIEIFSYSTIGIIYISSLYMLLTMNKERKEN